MHLRVQNEIEGKAKMLIVRVSCERRNERVGKRVGPNKVKSKLEQGWVE